jgi:GntR family transcriptional regulator
MSGLGPLVRRRGGPPLYRQLAAALEEKIRQGELRPGDRLASENELTTTLRVSRATVTKALDELMARGLLVREQGRGTFVAGPPMERRPPVLRSFTEQIDSLGHRPGHRLLSYEHATAHEGDAILSAYPPGTKLVVIRRLRLVDDRPVGLHRSAVPAEVAAMAGVTERALSEPGASLYALLEAGGLFVCRAHEALRAVNARPEEARLMETEPGSALIEVVRDSYDARDQLVDVVQARYPGSTYLYNIDLVRPPWGGRMPIRGEEPYESPESAENGTGHVHSIGLAAVRRLRG